MLSLIIAVTFIAISSKINKNIKLSWNINQFIEEKNKIDIAINSGNIINISKNRLLINSNKNQRIFSLKKQEELLLSFSWTNDFNIQIWIWKWGALQYKYILDWNTSSSWIINHSNSFTWKLDNTNNLWNLFFINLWGNTNFIIKSENEFETWEKNYKIVTKIWNNFFNETKNEY